MFEYNETSASTRFLSKHNIQERQIFPDFLPIKFSLGWEKNDGFFSYNIIPLAFWNMENYTLAGQRGPKFDPLHAGGRKIFN